MKRRSIANQNVNKFLFPAMILFTAVNHIYNTFLFSLKDLFFPKEKRLKGQWFIISAVVASTVFFSISLMLEGYFLSDSSEQASINKDFYFYNILEQVDKIIATTPTDVSCINLTTNLNEFKTVAEHTLAAKGYFTYLEYSVTPPCGAVNSVKLDLIIATVNGLLYNFSSYTDPRQIVNQSA